MKTKINYSEEDQQRLARLVRSRNAAQKVVLRAKIILKVIQGVKKKHIAEQLGTSRPTVNLWIKRFEKGGIGALLRDASRPALKPKIGEEKEKAINRGNPAQQTSQCYTLERQVNGQGAGCISVDSL